MARRDPRFDAGPWGRFARWREGEYDPSAGRLETRPPEGERRAEQDAKLLRQYAAGEHHASQAYTLGLAKRITGFGRIYRAAAVLLALLLAAVLLVTVSYLPAFGDVSAPENNEVARRYIEKGLAETGAVNIVAGMILDYRAFDTFGESCVLFAAMCCVLALLRVDKGEDPLSQAVEDMSDRYYEPRGDAILQMAARVLAPAIILLGIYVVLNGHLSPGGGFSGGAIIGTGLILCLTAFGFDRTGRYMTERLIKGLTVGALAFYCLAKSYSFYTGANHLPSVIAPGVPGSLLSAGLIPYLNICVGIVVACTMYCFYVMFRKGGY